MSKCWWRIAAVAAVLLLQLVVGGSEGNASEVDATRPFQARFGTGINLSNALEAAKEGDWGVVLQEEYFAAIQQAGFRHVRLPIRWWSNAAPEPPYTIDPKFLARIDWAVKCAKDHQLAIILDMHHDEGLMTEPVRHRERFKALWRQIATHYRGEPETVAFELLNEPQRKLDAEQWNALLAETLPIVRESNPTRTVILGPADYSNYHQLPTLKLPGDDKNLVVTFHYYDPFHFTHQGAEWVGQDSSGWLGTKWSGSAEEQKAIQDAFDNAAAWAKEHHVEIYLGEFGAYSKADMDSRVRWTRFVAEEARRRGMASAYWEFGAGFGAFDPKTMQWREPLLKALVVTADK